MTDIVLMCDQCRICQNVTFEKVILKRSQCIRAVHVLHEKIRHDLSSVPVTFVHILVFKLMLMLPQE